MHLSWKYLAAHADFLRTCSFDDKPPSDGTRMWTGTQAKQVSFQIHVDIFPKASVILHDLHLLLTAMSDGAGSGAQGLLRDCQAHGYLADCWVVNFMWRLTQRAPPKRLQAMASSKRWDQAQRLWYPGVNLRVLLSTASGSGGRYFP